MRRRVVEEEEESAVEDADRRALLEWASRLWSELKVPVSEQSRFLRSHGGGVNSDEKGGEAQAANVKLLVGLKSARERCSQAIKAMSEPSSDGTEALAAHVKLLIGLKGARERCSQAIKAREAGLQGSSPESIETLSAAVVAAVHEWRRYLFRPLPFMEGSTDYLAKMLKEAVPAGKSSSQKGVLQAWLDEQQPGCDDSQPDDSQPDASLLLERQLQRAVRAEARRLMTHHGILLPTLRWLPPNASAELRSCAHTVFRPEEQGEVADARAGDNARSLYSRKMTAPRPSSAPSARPSAWMQPPWMQPNGNWMQPNGNWMQPDGSWMQPNGRAEAVYGDPAKSATVTAVERPVVVARRRRRPKSAVLPTAPEQPPTTSPKKTLVGTLRSRVSLPLDFGTVAPRSSKKKKKQKKKEPIPLTRKLRVATLMGRGVAKAWVAVGSEAKHRAAQVLQRFYRHRVQTSFSVTRHHGCLLDWFFRSRERVRAHSIRGMVTRLLQKSQEAEVVVVDPGGVDAKTRPDKIVSTDRLPRRELRIRQVGSEVPRSGAYAPQTERTAHGMRVTSVVPTVQTTVDGDGAGQLSSALAARLAKRRSHYFEGASLCSGVFSTKHDTCRALKWSPIGHWRVCGDAGDHGTELTTQLIWCLRRGQRLALLRGVDQPVVWAMATVASLEPTGDYWLHTDNGPGLRFDPTGRRRERRTFFELPRRSMGLVLQSLAFASLPADHADCSTAQEGFITQLSVVHLGLEVDSRNTVVRVDGGSAADEERVQHGWTLTSLRVDGGDHPEPPEALNDAIERCLESELTLELEFECFYHELCGGGFAYPKDQQLSVLHRNVWCDALVLKPSSLTSQSSEAEIGTQTRLRLFHKKGEIFDTLSLSLNASNHCLRFLDAAAYVEEFARFREKSYQWGDSLKAIELRCRTRAVTSQQRQTYAAYAAMGSKRTMVPYAREPFRARRTSEAPGIPVPRVYSPLEGNSSRAPDGTRWADVRDLRMLVDVLLHRADDRAHGAWHPVRILLLDGADLAQTRAAAKKKKIEEAAESKTHLCVCEEDEGGDVPGALPSEDELSKRNSSVGTARSSVFSRELKEAIETANALEAMRKAAKKICEAWTRRSMAVYGDRRTPKGQLRSLQVALSASQQQGDVSCHYVPILIRQSVMVRTVAKLVENNESLPNSLLQCYLEAAYSRSKKGLYHMFMQCLCTGRLIVLLDASSEVVKPDTGVINYEEEEEDEDEDEDEDPLAAKMKAVLRLKRRSDAAEKVRQVEKPVDFEDAERRRGAQAVVEDYVNSRLPLEVERVVLVGNFAPDAELPYVALRVRRGLKADHDAGLDAWFMSEFGEQTTAAAAF